jgi:hypothetical protein
MVLLGRAVLRLVCGIDVEWCKSRCGAGAEGVSCRIGWLLCVDYESPRMFDFLHRFFLINQAMCSFNGF